jgi:hypothetical protein
MKINSPSSKLLLYAFDAAPGAFVTGLCLVLAIKHSSILELTFTVLFGIALVSGLLWTRRKVRRLADNDRSKEHATQFLWSCVFFSMLWVMFGIAAAGYRWISTDFIRSVGLIFWTLMAAVAIYPVWRDAKRLADATRSSVI